MTHDLYATMLPMLANGGDLVDLFYDLFDLFKVLITIGVIGAVIVLIIRANKNSKEADGQATIAMLTRRVNELEKRVSRLISLSSMYDAGQSTTSTPAQPKENSEAARQAAAESSTKPTIIVPTQPPAQRQSSVFEAITHLKQQKENQQQGEAAAAAESAKVIDELVTPKQAATHGSAAAVNAASAVHDSDELEVIDRPDTSSTHQSSGKNLNTTVEERLGTGVFIWIGGISLMLAGAFLVKYSFDNNLITPLMRVVLGTIFGLGLIGAAQYMHKKSRKIASALAGAAIADLFACLLAASSLYDLINSTTAFVLMIVVTGLSILLSLRHGRLVAVIGLIGGFVTPAIISEGNHQVGALLAYLMLLQVAMAVVNRRRGWVGMTTFTMCGGLLWSLILMAKGLSDNHRYMLEFFLVGSAALYILSASRMAAHPSEDREHTAWLNLKIALSSVSAAAVLIGLLVMQSQFAVMDMAMLGLLGLALIVLGRLRPKYEAMTWLAGAVSAATIFAWMFKIQFDDGYDASTDVKQFGITALLYGLLYAVGSYVAMWRSRKELYWAAGSAIAAVVFFFLAKAGLEGMDVLPWEHVTRDWAYLAIVAGLLYAILAYPVWRARLLYIQGNMALGVLVTTSALFMAIAGQLGLDFPWQLTVIAAIAAILAYLVQWQRIVGLREVAVFAGMIVTVFMIMPGTYKMEFSEQLIFNTILPAYALPAILLGLAAWLLRAKRDNKIGRVLRLQSIILGAAGVLALIRHGYHPTDMFDSRVTLFEWATYSTAALVMAHALLLWHKWRPGWPQQTMGALLVVLGVFDVIGGAGIFANPLWHPYAVGNLPVINALLFIYGVPAVLIALLLLNRPQTPDPQVNKIIPGSIGTLTLVIVFALISLQVRQYFHHPLLNTDGVSNPEMYSYSVAWILLGIALVAIGIRFKSKSMRYGSLAVMLIAIGKVFLLDTAHLEDLYRVISFLGLGVTLMVLGYVYQRFVFKRSSHEV